MNDKMENSKKSGVRKSTYFSEPKKSAEFVNPSSTFGGLIDSNSTFPSTFHNLSDFTVLPSSTARIQHKLKNNRLEDKNEQEAERVSRRVMNKTGNEKENNMMQAKVLSSQSDNSRLQDHPALESQLKANKGGGSPLPEDTKISMSHAFGIDFSHVRIHTDAAANQLNNNIQSKAFTYGMDIYLKNGQYNPGSLEGKKLLAHELTHVAQQMKENTPGTVFNLNLSPENVQKYENEFYFRPEENDLEYALHNFLYKHGNLTLDQYVKVANTFIDCAKKYNITFEKKKTYKLFYKARFKDKRVDYIYVIIFKQAKGRNKYEVFQHSWGEKVTTPEKGKPIPEHLKKRIEQISEGMSTLDKWYLRWIDFFNPDIEARETIRVLREKWNSKQKLISRTLAAGDIAEKTTRFIAHVKFASSYKPGTRRATEEFVKLADVVGDLFKSISKVAPPGVNMALEALAEAAKMIPEFVARIKKQMLPHGGEQWRKIQKEVPGGITPYPSHVR
jgi:hypothetical protein